MRTELLEKAIGSPDYRKYIEENEIELSQGILKSIGCEIETREPKRMDEVLRMIKSLWEQYPDFRLGQLLVNICGKEDLFYVEDEELVKALQKNKFPIEEDK